MESGALGIEVIVSGKARVQRAKSMKFKSGFLITTGHPAQVRVVQCLREFKILALSPKIFIRGILAGLHRQGDAACHDEAGRARHSAQDYVAARSGGQERPQDALPR